MKEEETILEENQIIQLPSDIRDGEGKTVQLGVGLSLTLIRQAGGGGGGGGALAPDGDTGPVFEDDFDRADAAAVGNGWVEYLTASWDIQSAALRGVAFNGIRACQQEGVSGGAMFVQCKLQALPGNAFPMLLARSAAASDSPTEGYALRLSEATDLIELFRIVAGSFTLLGSAASTIDESIYYPTQLYVADGLQQGWANGASVSDTDTAHDGQNSRAAGVNAQGSSGTFTSLFDDFIWTPSPFIAVSGLSAGQKAKVLNSGESVVAEATESGGTATIDCSRFGGATEIVPIGGWAALIVTDAGDNELARYDAAGIYPGYAYTAS